VFFSKSIPSALSPPQTIRLILIPSHLWPRDALQNFSFFQDADVFPSFQRFPFPRSPRSLRQRWCVPAQRALPPFDNFPTSVVLFSSAEWSSPPQIRFFPLYFTLFPLPSVCPNVTLSTYSRSFWCRLNFFFAARKFFPFLLPPFPFPFSVDLYP